MHEAAITTIISIFYCAVISTIYSVCGLFFRVPVQCKTKEQYTDQNHKSCLVESHIAKRKLSRQRCQKECAFLIPRWLIGATNLIYLHAVKNVTAISNRGRRYLKERCCREEKGEEVYNNVHFHQCTQTHTHKRAYTNTPERHGAVVS